MRDSEAEETVLKAFSLTHIVYDPDHPLSIPLSLLSLSPIFLFVSYFTLVIFTRRLTTTILAVGQVGNEVFSLALKRLLRAERPYPHLPHVGDGYGMPSSHSQAAGFLLAWGVGYALTLPMRYPQATVTGPAVTAGSAPVLTLTPRVQLVRNVRTGVYLFGLALWSVLVAYSRMELRYHSILQIVAGYTVGLVTGAAYFVITEYIPLSKSTSSPARLRRAIENIWVGVGGVGGWQLGGAEGGWGEGWALGAGMDKKAQ